MKVQTVQTDRLQKLAGHLLRGEPGLDRFDFTKYYDYFECGTEGCAIGECPTVFPEDWEFNEAKSPVLKSFRERTDLLEGTQASGMEFFGLSRREFKELFVPGEPAPVTGMELGIDATREEVANRILKFCYIQNQTHKTMKTQIDRLGKLAGHLLRGKLGLDRFDFTKYYARYECGTECGTEGCAIGECPTVFPQDWEINEAKSPVLKSFRERTDGPRGPKASAMEFFGLSEKEFQELFVPASPAPVTGMELGKDALKAEVALKILCFCLAKLQEQNPNPNP